MALTGNFAAVASKTTAAVGATNKVTALTGALFDAIAIEITKGSTLTPKQQNKLAAARAHVLANTAQIQTAVGL
jgi:hypothetical protein